eukprot:Filipodium_phascolosomae@DN458_c0_g1_i1.p1
MALKRMRVWQAAWGFGRKTVGDVIALQQISQFENAKRKYRGTMEDFFCSNCETFLMPSESGASMICLACGRCELRGEGDKVVSCMSPQGVVECSPHLMTADDRAAFLQVLEDDRANLFAERDSYVSTRARISEKCPQCGNKYMEFWTMQLRSADEGQTVFYQCPKCEYTNSVNT